MDQNFADRVEDIESIHDENPDLLEQGGTGAAAYSGEEYRQELREGLEDREDLIRSLPWGAGSGFRGENPGYFFCARVGDDVFMRFVSAVDGEEMTQDTLTCLRRIECTSDTERDLPEEFRTGVYDAWDRARTDIYRQWQEQTDPRNVQPDIPRLFREVADHLRNHWPDEMTQEKLEETVDSVEAPWGKRYERELRDVFEQEDLSVEAKSQLIVEKVDDLGLQPFEAPEPLSPIQENEVQLVCWLAIAPEPR